MRKQTNHLTTQLVNETAEASEAKGLLAGNIEGRAELKKEQAGEQREATIFPVKPDPKK